MTHDRLINIGFIGAILALLACVAVAFTLAKTSADEFEQQCRENGGDAYTHTEFHPTGKGGYTTTKRVCIRDGQIIASN